MDMNNEMDELFRKAGEDYPLNLGKPDWDAVAGKLSALNGAPGSDFGIPVAGPRKGRSYRWLLLLLLPAGIYGMLRYSTAGVLHSRKIVSSRTVAASAKIDSTASAEPDSRITSRGSAIPDGRTTLRGNGMPDGSIASTASATVPPGAGSDAGYRRRTPPPNGGHRNRANDDRQNGAMDRHPAGKLEQPYTDQGSTKQDTARAAAGLTPVQSGAVDSIRTSPEKDPGSLAGLVMANLEKAAEKSEKKTNPVVTPSIKRQRGFYAGLVAAPDFSTVKFQSLKSTGYSFGVVAGYRFNRHLSVESGLSWDRKKYYSQGKYFDKSRTKIPPAVNVTYLDGYCEMFEIPVTIRYDLKTTRTGGWFAAAGFSTYLMKNENYMYGAETNNVSWSGKVDYKNSGSNFFSVLQLSAGYEYNWNARNRFRIEPYFKAPVIGIGIGRLPVSSVGITFGVIHSFH